MLFGDFVYVCIRRKKAVEIRKKMRMRTKVGYAEDVVKELAWRWD